MIEALGSLGNELDIILASPGLEAATAEKVASQGVQHIDGAVRLDGLLDECALCINHASIGTCAAFLMAGVPQIGLPSQIEQMMLAHALAKSGAGIGLNGKASVVEMRGIVLQALDASQMREAARRIQEKYRGSLQTNVADVVASRALALTR
jgi:UDP:flavonoid glycosyltransferase YjiC (YdhE family)